MRSNPENDSLPPELARRATLSLMGLTNEEIDHDCNVDPPINAAEELSQYKAMLDVVAINQSEERRLTMTATKYIHIIGGGTVFHMRPHFALCAPAYGTVAKQLADIFMSSATKLETKLHLTKMAGGCQLETNCDISNLVDRVVADPATKIVVMAAALCDFEPVSGCFADKYGDRLKSREGNVTIEFSPSKKIIGKIRQKRKDIFAIGFKTTSGASPDEQYIAGLNLLKESSLNLVLANDVSTRLNMIITPEEARYHESTDRDGVLHHLVEMALLRSHLTFTRSTVVSGTPVPWDSPEVPGSLRSVVDYCVAKGAYKPFRGATVGHFACKLKDNEFLTSIRKSNFNDLHTNGLVRVVTDGPDSVIAYGAKPSVGGQSQRIVFSDHPEYDCIVHFHCPIREGSPVPTVSQREYECGSHQCGENTSKGLVRFGDLSAVYLDNHGPNIVFNRSIDPANVISFIEDNFDLEGKTGGYVELGAILAN